MPKLTSKYETIFVVDVTLGEEQVNHVIEKFKTMIAENGTVTNVADWGKRRLAYTIDYKTEGYYVLVNYTAPATLPAEVERVMRITDSVMRFVTVKK